MPKDLEPEKIENITIDKDMVIGFQVVTFPKNQMNVVIQHATGHMVAEVIDEVEVEFFRPVNREKPVQVNGEKLQTLMNTKLSDLIASNPDMTIYEAIKQLLYAELG